MKSFTFLLFISSSFCFQNNLTLQTGASKSQALEDELRNLTAANAQLTNAYQQLQAGFLALQGENATLKAENARIPKLEEQNADL